MNKKLGFSLLIALLLCTTFVYAQTDTSSEEIRSVVVNKGVGLGAVIAVVASWSRNGSILWAIFHGILSWFYVIYFAVTRNANN